MNALPISMNPAGSGNAGAAPGSQTGTPAGLSPFAQVLAEKRSVPNAPESSSAASRPGAENAAVPQNATRPQATSNAAAQSNTGCSVQSTISTLATTPANLAKKNDHKAKGPIDPGANSAVSSTTLLAVAITVNAMAPVTAPHEALANFPQDAAKNAEAPVAATAQPSYAQPPAVDQIPPSGLSSVQAQNPLGQQSPATATGTLQNLPSVLTTMPPCATSLAVAISVGNLSSSEGTPSPDVRSGSQEVPVVASVLQSANAPIATPLATNDPVTVQTGAGQPTTLTLPSAAAAGNSATAGMATTELRPPSQKTVEPGNTHISMHVAEKHHVADFLREVASAVAKSAEAVVQASASVAKDAANALKNVSAGSKSDAAVASTPAVDTKTELAVGEKSETPATPLVADPGKGNATNTGNNAGQAPDGGDASSADNSVSAGSNIASKDHGVNVGPEPLHGGAPALQGDPPNEGSGAPAAMSPIAATSAKEAAGTAKSANGNSADGAGTAVADDIKPQMLESKAVNVAQLTGNDAHSEVRIAMQADQLGQVELHATVNGQQVGAAITVEKKEAHAAMAVELPSLQQALEERNLRVSEVVLTQSTLHSTAGDAGNAGNAPAEQRRGQAGTQYQQAQRDAAYAGAPAASLENRGILDGHGRLSVRV